jgi:hypothetical protein
VFPPSTFSQGFTSKIPRRHSLQGIPAPQVSSTRSSLDTIAEVEGTQALSLTRAKPLQRANSVFSKSTTVPTTEPFNLITAADILNIRPPPARPKSTPTSHLPQPRYSAEGAANMQVLKRSERDSSMAGQQRRPSNLRRAGSAMSSSEYFSSGGQQQHHAPVERNSEVLEGWGALPPEPTSPTRPPSIVRVQSLKVMNLEKKVDTLHTENAILVQRNNSLSVANATHKEAEAALNVKLEDAQKVLEEKKSEIEELNKKLAWYKEEVARLVDNNKGLVKNNKGLSAAYKMSQANFTMRLENKTTALEELSKEHEVLKERYAKLEINSQSDSLSKEIEQKNAELALLRAELQKAREEVRSLERKVMARQSNRYLDIKEPAHFAASSEALFQEVQKWCEDFSRLSAGRRCITVHRITDDAIRERFESVMLDDRGVRNMLKDESRRATALSAILMRLIWEFVFTRYLFGLEPEERQKLLLLERTLAEAGEPPAVHQWRATTLTLLIQRSSFRGNLMSATETTLNDIMAHLNQILPPPPQHAATVISTLRTLITHAVQLALEMRTQRAEYVMQRAPWPEYDDHGEIANTVSFDAARMHAVDGASDADLQQERVTVRCVLFPLIIRHGNEFGEEYENEHVVYPMQVLVNRGNQLHSESRSSLRSSRSSLWRDDQGTHKQNVSRLTPITDHSPRTTPENPMRRHPGEQDVIPPLPRTQTIRLVQHDEDEEMQWAGQQTPAVPPRYVGGEVETKKRRVGEM